MKRFLSSLLVLCMAMTFLPASAAAASVSPFGDVQSTDWYYDEVQYVYENGLMSGTSATTFSPDTTTTRGMIVTILHRLEGTPAVSTSGTFADVTAGRYYTDAVEWASANGIVGGYGNGRFGPNDPITREQMAAILYRYAAYKEYDVSGAADLSGYSDASSISSYARVAMQWANHSGLVNGTSDTTLSPQGSATRAQAAVILYRFCEEILGGIETEGEFTVTFEYNYGSKGTYETVKVDAGETVERPKNPTRSGYDFDGWYTKTTGGTKFDFDDAIIADLTLYAHWSGNSGGGSSGGSSHRHSYIGTVTTQPTCTTEGVKTYTCSCGDSYTEAIPATGHSYAETVLKAATCQEAGEKYEVCSACGAVQNSVEIPALGHKWDEGKLTQAATCSSTGIMTYTCDNCGGTYTQEIERADHTWGAWETSAASCVTDEQTRACAVCGSIERRSESGTGSHNWNDWSHDESANTHSRTCQTTGCTAAETAICTFDDWTPDPDDSSKHVHNCQICRYSESVGHIWGEMVLDTETYVGTYTCAACGAKKAETYVASVGAVYYTDLSSAIAAAEDGDAVVLLADAENVDLTISKAIILNTNGRTLTGTLAYAAVENVKLTSVGDGLTVKIGDKTAAFEADTAGGLMVVKSAADESGNLDIYTLEGLQDFANAVDKGTTYKNLTVTLMSDIDLNNEMWTPIGRNADSSNKFQGTFDGSGKTISHLTVEAAVEYGATGFFGALNGTARNFTLDGVTIDSVSYGAASGSTSNGIAAVAGSIYNSGSIEGVTVKNATIHGNRYVGGIAGYVYGQIKNCTVENSTISATPDNLTGSYDNGDKVGGIAGYLGEGSNTVSGNAVKDVNLSAYRDVGGIVGCAQNETAVSGNMVFHAHITADQQTNFYGAKDVNASYEVGRNLGAAVSGNDVSEAEGSMTLKLPESYADSLTLTGSTTLVGAANGSRIAPSTEGESAIVINGTVMLTVKGSITAAGATGGDGIEVPSGSSLELTGDTLTALGNGGTDGENNSGKYGSGIGNAKDTVGSIYIHDMLSLTAEGYGNHAFGIGGNMTGTLKIEGTAIAYAKGGWVKSVCDEDDTWHKKSPEGGAAIGIGLSATSNTIILNNTTVKRAEGGAKSAAIGGQYWSNPVIEIDGCTLTNIQGGTDSAGVGGSRINANGYTSTITINDSTVEAKGGCYGAGIGSGYNGYTNEAANHLTTIYITGDSKIVAVGGTAAAGIGTGHHAYMLAGAIDASVNTTGTKAGDPAVVELQGYWNEDPTAWCTSAMDIGYGSLDQTREGKLLDVVFTIGGNMIENPVSDAE